jgi:hypothetical protein
LSGEGELFVIEKFDAGAISSNFGDSRPDVSVFDAIAADPSTCTGQLPADRPGVDPAIGRERLQKKEN